MEAHTCNHPKVPHTVWWWIGDGGPPVPMSAAFDNLEDADIFAQKIIRQNDSRMSWLKIFRSDNESYTCFRWEKPMKENSEMDLHANKVKLEIDMEPLASAFENVAQGFKAHGRALKGLWFTQAMTTTVILVHFADHLLR